MIDVEFVVDTGAAVSLKGCLDTTCKKRQCTCSGTVLWKKACVGQCMVFHCLYVGAEMCRFH